MIQPLSLKQRLLKEPDANGVFKNIKIADSLKHLSNIWRSFEMLLINCKIHSKLCWTENCVMSTNDANTTFKKTK